VQIRGEMWYNTGRIQGKMEEDPLMLIDRHPSEDVFARVPEVAAQTDPVLKQLDVLLDDDALYQQVRDDLGKRYRWTLVQGQPGLTLVLPGLLRAGPR